MSKLTFEMKVSEEERQLILSKREKEGFYEPKKVGFLKEDMWIFHNSSSEFISLNKISIWSTTEKEEILQHLKDWFELLLPARAKFYCYIDENVEYWTGPDDGFESMNSVWAKKYLTDITNF